ncbi:MAG: aldo/keto reductase [Chthonomonadaceae bacterium]|nr:aldo/keto reductase [Chthonomonadaceae bacterium]
MRMRVLGAEGPRISEVGLGCWQLGGSDWGDLSEQEAMAILQTSVESGVDFFDTADVYGLGRSESLIGKFLKETKADVCVATKLGRYPEPGWPGNFTEAAYRQHVEASLKRLGVEALDLEQIHCIPTEEYQRGDCFDWLRTLQQEGKIRQFGVSVESMEEAKICVQQEGLTSLQIIFNLFRQKPIASLFAEAERRNVGLIVRLPLASGLLAGKYSKETTFADADHRNYNRDGQAFNVGETFAGLPFEKGVEFADTLKPLVPEGMTMAQMALRWCLDFPAVTTIIPGAKDPAMARANAAVSDLPSLPADLHTKLTLFYAEHVEDSVRGPY